MDNTLSDDTYRAADGSSQLNGSSQLAAAAYLPGGGQLRWRVRRRIPR